MIDDLVSSFNRNVQELKGLNKQPSQHFQPLVDRLKGTYLPWFVALVHCM